MTLTDVFKTNCRATASLCKNDPSLSFKDLTSGLGGKNKNGVIARFSFDEFFIDLYFIENGPLAYAPNTIWISVGFQSVPFLPFSVYDILAVADRENFKCYTYPYLYTSDVMIQAFGEINDLFKTFIPAMEDLSETGTLKNNLIESQKEAINKFVNDDIFKREIEMLDASLKIREMLIRNFVEAVISRVILGGLSDFFNNDHKNAVKKLEKAKYLTFYENRLFKKLRDGELKGYDASPYRDEKYKNYNSLAKKRTYSLGTKGFFRFIIPTILTTPIFTAILIFVYLILCHLKFNDALFYMNCDLFSIVTLLLAGFMIGELFSFHFSHKLKNPFKKKKEKAVVPEVKNKSKILKHFTIIVETIVIVLLFSAVNSSLVFTENKVAFPEDSFLSLRQQSMRYEYFDTVYKVRGVYIQGTNYVEREHYILVTQNGEMLDFAYFPDNNKEFREKILPYLLENGCTLKEIESEKDIK